jgi:hypothetical protein
MFFGMRADFFYGVSVSAHGGIEGDTRFSIFSEGGKLELDYLTNQIL